MSKVSIEVDTKKRTIDVVVNGKKVNDVSYVQVLAPYEGAPKDYKMVSISAKTVTTTVGEDGKEDEVETYSYTYAKLLEELNETD